MTKEDKANPAQEELKPIPLRDTPEVLRGRLKATEAELSKTLRRAGGSDAAVRELIRQCEQEKGRHKAAELRLRRSRTALMAVCLAVGVTVGILLSLI